MGYKKRKRALEERLEYLNDLLARTDQGLCGRRRLVLRAAYGEHLTSAEKQVLFSESTNLSPWAECADLIRQDIQRVEKKLRKLKKK